MNGLLAASLSGPLSSLSLRTTRDGGGPCDGGGGLSEAEIRPQSLEGHFVRRFNCIKPYSHHPSVR